jgi:hypothetical protein
MADYCKRPLDLRLTLRRDSPRLWTRRKRMPLKRHQANVNPAIPPYLTDDEQRFVEMCLATGGKFQEISRLWPNVTGEKCERLAADPRVSAECEYRRELISKVMHAEQPEPRPGHDPHREHEHIANAFLEVHARTAAPQKS